MLPVVLNMKQYYTLNLLLGLIYFIVCFIPTIVRCKVLWAVNCGGEEHTDVNGIKYQADFVNDGVASDYGRSFMINRIPMEDQIIYQTERYNTGDFSYRVPITKDGHYVITLKFSEVWFSETHQKIFTVFLENNIQVVQSLDVFGEVGFATALDIHIPFHIEKKVLFSSDGSIDVPKLPEIENVAPQKPVLPKTVEHVDNLKRKAQRKPKTTNPYSSTDFSYLILPILATVGAILPVLFCLCKL